MSSLQRTVPYRPGESVLSFGSRLGAANGRPLHAFLRDMGLHSGALARGDENEVARLARLGRVHSASLMSSAVIRTEAGFTVCGERLQRGMIPFNMSRVCPSCIREDVENGEGPVETRAYYRSTWAISLVRTCPRHSATLVTIEALPRGHHHQDIASLVRHGLEQVASAEPEAIAPSGLEEYLQQRLDGTAPADDFLASLPLYVAARLSEMIGGMILFGKNFHSGKLAPRDWLDAGREGFVVTAGGADGIREFLSQGFGNYLRSQRNVGGKVLFGTLHTWLLQSSKNPDYDPVRELVREHVVDTLPIGPGEALLGPVTRRRWHSLHSAALEYGVHPKRLRKLLHEAGHITDAEMDLSDGRVLLEVEKVRDFLESVAASLIGEDARRYVVASRVQWDILTREGFVKPMIPATDASQSAYSRRDLDDFLTAVAYSTGASGTHLRHPSTAARIALCTLADVLRMLMERRLKEVAIARIQRGFAAVLVNPAEVRSLLPKKETRFLSQNEARKRMGITGRTLTRLVAAGHVPSTLAKVPGAHHPVRAIKPEDADAFPMRYVTLPEITEAMGFGLAYRLGRKALDEMGIYPVFDPVEVGCRIYERADLAEVFPI